MSQPKVGVVKTVSTLVQDIYELISNPRSFHTNNVLSFGRALAERMAHRLAERRGSNTLRASSLGKPCDRQTWYGVNDHDKAEPLPPQARLKFLFGDVLEELLLFLAREAGHDVVREQHEIDIDGVKGHIDAIVDGHLVDCKSASSIAFEKFKEHRVPDDDPFGYLDQLSSYLYGSRDLPELKDKDVASFLVIDKNLGHVTLDTYPASGKDYNKVVADKREMLSRPEPPPRPFDAVPFLKSGNKKLGVACSYCPFKHHCWADANEGKGLRTFLYANGPVFLTDVKREGKVTEVDKNGVLVNRETKEDPF